MVAIGLGLVAALGWGLHDFAVRYLSQRMSIYAAILSVLVFGLLFLSPVVMLTVGVGPVGASTLALSVGSGVAFTLAVVSLYKAFAIGPVRRVAPIIGAYPVLSTAWAVLAGEPVALLSWVAVLFVVGGIWIVASGSDQSEAGRTRAVSWSLCASVLFALAFGLGQEAAHGPDTGAALLISRASAVVTAGVLAAILRIRIIPDVSRLWILVAMGALDAIALTAVLVASNWPHSSFATTASSTFGVVTIILAYVFLKEPVNRRQWGGVVLVFAAIAYLAGI